MAKHAAELRHYFSGLKSNEDVRCRWAEPSLPTQSGHAGAAEGGGVTQRQLVFPGWQPDCRLGHQLDQPTRGCQRRTTAHLDGFRIGRLTETLVCLDVAIYRFRTGPEESGRTCLCPW